jgi:hypothetical protein
MENLVYNTWVGGMVEERDFKKCLLWNWAGGGG